MSDEYFSDGRITISKGSLDILTQLFYRENKLPYNGPDKGAVPSEDVSAELEGKKLAVLNKRPPRLTNEGRQLIERYNLCGS